MSKLQKILLRRLFIICMVIVIIIIAVHLNYQIRGSYLSSSKTNTSLRYIPSNPNTTTSLTPNRSSQYIWCVNHYGPNNQLGDFVKCCIIAIINNYTVIIPPLFPHYADKIQGVQWFDHFYDLKRLSLALNFITLDQFISEKINKKEVKIDCFIEQIPVHPYETWDPKKTLGSIKNAFKINITFHHHINVSLSLTMKDLSNKAKHCSSIFLHVRYLALTQFFWSPDLYTQSIFKHIYRTPLIQRIASALIKFLPQIVINRNQRQNRFHTLAVIHMRLGDRVVMSVSMYIEQILYLIKNGVRFTHLHIMCPYLKASDIKQLTDSLPIPFTATQHLLPHVHSLLDEYLFDVLEQEVAYQAPIFLATPASTYSATVLMQKVCHKKGTTYMLSNKDKNPPILVTEKTAKYFY